MKINKKKLIKRWGDLEQLPLFELIEQRLKSKDFEFDRVDIESGIAYFKKPFGQFNLSVVLNPGIYRGDLVKFQVSIYLESKAVYQIEQKVKAWLCNPAQVDFCDQDGNYPDNDSPIDFAVVYRIHLYNFLKYYEHPDAIPSFKYNCRASLEAVIDQMMSGLEFIFFKVLPKLEKDGFIESELVRVASNPNRPNPYNFIAADPFVYAALLQFLKSQKDKALTTLKLGLSCDLKQDEENWQHDPSEMEGAFAITKCSYKKYEDYILNNLVD